MNYVFPVVFCRDVIVINWEELYAVLAKIKKKKAGIFNPEHFDLLRKPAKATGCRNCCASFSGRNRRFLPILITFLNQALSLLALRQGQVRLKADSRSW